MSVSFANNPLVSVIIPSFNAEQFLHDTIISVCNQTYSNLEIIVVNDGSYDNTQSIAEEIAKKDHRVICIWQENAGVSAARNHGMNRSNGDYIALLDADDLMTPTSIEERLKYFESGNFGLVHCDLQIIDNTGTPTGEIKSGKEGAVLDDLLAWRQTVIPTPSSVVFKKSVFEQIGGFDIRLSNNADQEFFYRVAAKFLVGRVSKPLGMYRIHQNQMHKNIKLMYRDTLLAYKLASKNGLFKSSAFRRKCYSRMYFILANCFLKDAKRPLKAFILYLFAFVINPKTFVQNFF